MIDEAIGAGRPARCPHCGRALVADSLLEPVQPDVDDPDPLRQPQRPGARGAHAMATSSGLGASRAAGRRRWASVGMELSSRRRASLSLKIIG